MFEIGKIINYDLEVGEILTISSKKCYFLKQDLNDDYLNLKDKVVVFRIEIINNQARAYYIRSLESVIKNKKIANKILNKVNKITNNSF